LLFGLFNHLLYKFKFNSYQLNGATVTTLIIFLTQNVVMGLVKMERVGWRWWVGVAMITGGVAVLYAEKERL
jgi:drug/metabolite transporter (DMT)-like permease